MDTLLSLSDNEIEDISLDNELVLFDRIKKYYSPTSDLRVSYLLGEAVVASSYDWVGLFRPGWASTNSYINYQWAPIKGVSAHAPRRRRVVVPQSTWSGYQNEDKFQLLYVTSTGDVVGVSCSFRIGEPEEPDLNFDLLERPLPEASSVSVVESFSNKQLYLDTISLLSESDSGHSSPSNLEDVDTPVKSAWDSNTLSGDFTGKSWFEELELLPENTIVKEYEPVDDRSLVPYVPLPLKDFSGSPKTYQPIADVNDRRSYSIFFDEDVDEEAMSLFFENDELKASNQDKEITLPKTAVPEYPLVEGAIEKLYKELVPQALQDKESSVIPEEECIPLLSDDDLTFSDVPLDSTKSRSELEIIGCPPNLFSSKDASAKVVPLYSVDEGKSAIAVFNAEKKKREKQEKIQKAIQILHGLISLIPGFTAAPPRPLGCAPDCTGCVVSQGVLSHYHQRFLAAEENVQKLKEEVETLQKSLDEKDATKSSAKDLPSPILMSSLSNVMGMVRYVQKANETNALLDQALAVTLAEKHQLEKGQVTSTSAPQNASEKGQQTEVKVVRDEATECVDPPQNTTFHFEDEEQDGWSLKNSKKIDRLKRAVARKEEDLKALQDNVSGKQVQLLMVQDTVKELRKNVREERRLAKAARQEVLKLRRQVSALKSNRKRVAWGGDVTSRDVGVSIKPQTATVGTESRFPRRHTFAAHVYPKPKFTSGVSAFYPERKAFRQDMNMQIRTGRCKTCGMRFSPTVDRRLIEEHIIFHLQFQM
ncbi:uncharacterized protein [Haliotis cracherodii]|uniref:uncharacterized protein n=1 Tax=Haliotis cracherodii TaxID=6455 RepID=UPI0039EC8EAE